MHEPPTIPLARPARTFFERATRWWQRITLRCWSPARTRLLLGLLQQHGEQTPDQLATHTRAVMSDAMMTRHLGVLLERGWITVVEHRHRVRHYALAATGALQCSMTTLRRLRPPRQLAVPCCRCQFPVYFALPGVVWPKATSYATLSGRIQLAVTGRPDPTLFLERAYCVTCAPFGISDTQ